MNLAGYPYEFSLSQATKTKLSNAVSSCSIVVVGTQESSTETSFIDVLERDVLKPNYFQRKRTQEKKIQSSFVQYLMRAATVVAEYATWMFCAYKTPRIYVYTFKSSATQVQQYKCLRPCGFTIESGNIWKGANFLKIQMSSKTLLVVNTHLFYTSHGSDHGLSLRQEQFKKIMERIVEAYIEDPSIILVFMGDLNFRMVYPSYTDDTRSYQQFIQQQSRKLYYKDDELHKFLQQETSRRNTDQNYTKIIEGLRKDIPDPPPLTCKLRSQYQDGKGSHQFLDKFQIRTDKKKGIAPQPSKQRKPSNCDKILFHKGNDGGGIVLSPIQTFKVKNTDHCGVYRTLSIP
jgi:hypothetical protein